MTCPDVFSGAGHLYFMASFLASHSCTVGSLFSAQDYILR